MPLTGKLLPQIEQSLGGRCVILEEVVTQIRNSAVFEWTSVLSCHIFNVHDGIRNGSVIELTKRPAKIRIGGVNPYLGTKLSYLNFFHARIL
jgi:hypothetical protein